MNNLFGMINTFFICFSVLGVYAQLTTIWARKKVGACQSTQTLSLKMFTTSYLAYYSVFVYGMAIEPFNHFIVWPRLIACLLVAAIIYEIWRDRLTSFAMVITNLTLLSLFAAGCFAFTGHTYRDDGMVVMSTMIVGITLFLAFGYFAQIKNVIKTGTTGALDKKMSLYILLMDFSTIAFAISLGMGNGWPLLLLATVSGITKVIILYLFRWVEVSTRANQIRASVNEVR